MSEASPFFPLPPAVRASVAALSLAHSLAFNVPSGSAADIAPDKWTVARAGVDCPAGTRPEVDDLEVYGPSDFQVGIDCINDHHQIHRRPKSIKRIWPRVDVDPHQFSGVADIETARNNFCEPTLREKRLWVAVNLGKHAGEITLIDFTPDCIGSARIIK